MNRPDHVVVVLVVDLKPSAMAWGWWRVARGGRALRNVPGLRFAKVMGSGHEGGFGLRPSATHQGLFAVFDTEAAADAFMARSDTVAAYRRRAREWFLAKLRAVSCRGSWAGQSLEVTAPVPADGPVASLTRASIRPAVALDFWRRSPSTENSLERASGCLLAVGLGEAPLLRQATFSLWRDQAAMDAYARTGAHQDAIQAARRQGYFSESMFVRFALLALSGSWKGRALAMGSAPAGADA